MSHSLLYLCLIFAVQCTTKKEVATNPPSKTKAVEKTIACTTHAIVEDHTGLDGCGLMFHLDNGEKWLPTNLDDPKFKAENNDEIYFGYRTIEDGVQTSMYRYDPTHASRMDAQ